MAAGSARCQRILALLREHFAKHIRQPDVMDPFPRSMADICICVRFKLFTFVPVYSICTIRSDSQVSA